MTSSPCMVVLGYAGTNVSSPLNPAKGRSKFNVTSHGDLAIHFTLTSTVTLCNFKNRWRHLYSRMQIQGHRSVTSYHFSWWSWVTSQWHNMFPGWQWIKYQGRQIITWCPDPGPHISYVSLTPGAILGETSMSSSGVTVPCNCSGVFFRIHSCAYNK